VAEWRTPSSSGPRWGPPVRSSPVTRSLTPKRLFVLGIVIALAVSYLGSVRGYLEQRHELARQQIALRAMIDQREHIQARLAQLTNPSVVEARARELGYVMPGEIPLRVTGLERAAKQEPAPSGGGGFWGWLPDVF